MYIYIYIYKINDLKFEAFKVNKRISVTLFCTLRTHQTTIFQWGERLGVNLDVRRFHGVKTEDWVFLTTATTMTTASPSRVSSTARTRQTQSGRETDFKRTMTSPSEQLVCLSQTFSIIIILIYCRKSPFDNIYIYIYIYIYILLYDYFIE